MVALYGSLRSARNATTLEFLASPKIRAAHHCVKLPSGKWSRTLGAPSSKDLLPGRRLVATGNKLWRIEVEADYE